MVWMLPAPRTDAKSPRILVEDLMAMAVNELQPGTGTLETPAKQIRRSISQCELH